MPFKVRKWLMMAQNCCFIERQCNNHGQHEKAMNTADAYSKGVKSGSDENDKNARGMTTHTHTARISSAVKNSARELVATRPFLYGPTKSNYERTRLLYFLSSRAEIVEASSTCAHPESNW